MDISGCARIMISKLIKVFPDTSQARVKKWGDKKYMDEQKKEDGGQATTSAPAPQAEPNDVEKNKTMAILAYFIFFLPLVTDAKDSPFAKYHANQSLILLIFSCGAYLVSSVLTIMLIGFLLLPLVSIASFVLFIMGIINASNGKMKPLPLIGELFQIIK